MTHNERVERFKQDRDKVTASQMANLLGVTMSTVKRYEQKYGRCLKEDVLVREVEPREFVDSKKKVERLTETDRSQKRQIKALVEENEKLEEALQAVIDLEAHQPEISIPSPLTGEKTESTMVVVASDWHVSKTVDPNVVPGNTFNLKIAERRAQLFFQRVVKMLEFEQREVAVNHMVLALLGDFIEGSLHPDSMETAGTQPVQSTIIAHDLLVAGIQYILDNSDVTLSIPCLVGNHSRTTEKVRNSTEVGYSYEYMMYHFLADHFKDNPRVTFHISQSIHFYMEVYDQTLRFMHGHHGLRGGGGVGGLAIPLLRAIGKWDRTRQASITVLGHFHSVLDVIVGLVNGSLCGYDSYSMSMGFPFEKPTQVYFMINSKYGRNGYRKIHLEE